VKGEHNVGYIDQVSSTMLQRAY